MAEITPSPAATEAGTLFARFVELIARLRAPGGCPWDREQTHESVKPMTIEEAYEVAHAIDEKDDAELAGELGDLLLQVVFHANIAEERGAFHLRQRLAASLRGGCERELELGHKRVQEAVLPFARFVRGEGERLRAQSQELAGRRRDFDTLRTRIAGLR